MIAATIMCLFICTSMFHTNASAYTCVYRIVFVLVKYSLEFACSCLWVEDWKFWNLWNLFTVLNLSLIDACAWGRDCNPGALDRSLKKEPSVGSPPVLESSLKNQTRLTDLNVFSKRLLKPSPILPHHMVRTRPTIWYCCSILIQCKISRGRWASSQSLLAE